MGACNNGYFVETDSKEEVKTDFFNRQETDLYENGHMYSGGIGMAKGLVFDTTQEFDSINEAAEYLNERIEKWGPAIAVRINGQNETGWYYEALCAS